MLSGYTVSDLHLFSKRSQADRFIPAINQKAAKADLLVLNGDIFDFQWSKERRSEDTLSAAVQWIENLVTSHESCQFVFTIGNHDALPAYLHQLKGLSAKHRNLHWREHLFKIGPKLFLHGDALHGGATLEGLQAYRDSCSQKSYSNFSKNCYAGLTNLGVSSLANKLISKRRACSRLLTFLETAIPEETTNINDIYFGHTHNALDNYDLEGIRFHNCGGPFTGSKFRILPFSFPKEELIETIQHPGT